MPEPTSLVPSGTTPGLSQYVKELWRHRTLFGKVGLILGTGFLILQVVEWVCVGLGIVSNRQSDNPILKIWALLKDMGVVGGLSAFCWDSLKAKLQEKTEDKPTQDSREAPSAQGTVATDNRLVFSEMGEFVGLSFQQWFVTLSILFLTLLVTGILTAIFVGVRSLWWTAWPAQVVVGLLLTYMNFVAIRNNNFHSWLGVLVGLSPLVFVFTSCGGGWLLHMAGVNVVQGGGAQAPTWMGWSLVIYGIVIFLPAYRLFELVAPGTPPIRNSVGSWISVSYLALVVVLGAVLPLLTSGEKGGLEGLQAKIEKNKKVLAGADTLWEAGEKAKAIKEYKVFLKSDVCYQFGRERYPAYRRVIEYEAENGDAGEARDWALKALEDCAGEPERLSIQSTKARAIWSEIVADWEKRRDRDRGRK